jgi:predicted phage tail protein
MRKGESGEIPMAKSFLKRFPWFITVLGGILSAAFVAAVFRPGLFTSRGGPGATWIGLFVGLSVTFTGLQLLLAPRRNG